MIPFVAADVKRAVQASDLSPSQQRIMITLCSEAQPGTGLVSLGRRQIAVQTGLAPTTVYNNLLLLWDKRWLVSTGRHSPNRAKVWRIDVPTRAAIA